MTSWLVEHFHRRQKRKEKLPDKRMQTSEARRKITMSAPPRKNNYKTKNKTKARTSNDNKKQNKTKRGSGEEKKKCTGKAWFE